MPVHTIHIPYIEAKSKARPRANYKTGRVHSDPEYAKWRKQKISPHTTLFSLKHNKPKWDIQFLIIKLQLKSLRKDCDNLLGGILDQLKDDYVISGDTAKRVNNQLILTSKDAVSDIKIIMIHDEPRPELTFILEVTKILIGDSLRSLNLLIYELAKQLNREKADKIVLTLEDES